MDEIIIVAVGNKRIALRSFDEVLAFMAPCAEPPIEIDHVLQRARTVEQKRLALQQFKKWACRAGILLDAGTTSNYLERDAYE